MPVTEESLEAYYRASALATRRNMQVRAWLSENPGSTNEEIAEGTGLPLQTVTPRTRELKYNGAVWITGRKRTALGQSAAMHEVASCPVCGSPELAATRRDPCTFAYSCVPCGSRFVARVGRGQSEPVVILPSE